MKKLRLLSLIAVLLIVVSCSKDEEIQMQEEVAISQEKALSTEEINAKIRESLETKGSFDWKDASDHLLWSATVHGGKILTVGYGSESFSITKSASLSDIKSEILKTVAITSNKKSSKSPLIYEDDVLNLIDVEVHSVKAVAELRKNPNIRYLEPEGYIYKTSIKKSSLGCGQGSDTIVPQNYNTMASGAKIPWSFYDHNVDKAWAHSTGRGVGVAVIDTGISPNQPNLGHKFDDYYSNRTIQKYGTYVDSWWWWSRRTDGVNDKCGHGTAASATIGAPNNNTGDFVGVAYECNIVSYRGTKDVVLNGYHERKGVANALTELGNRGDVKIISMSIGYPWSIGRIADAVRYANSRGKLIFAAGGTSTSFTNWYGIIFPANMNETVAVTGIKEDKYQRCDACHDGGMDFTMEMERADGTRHPVLGFNGGESAYFGGSSVATAFTAGVAALVWSKYPNWNKNQVLQRLRESGELYPNRNSRFGYGNIDALKAVRGY